jgi:Tol biopolymer transport system component
VLYEMVTGRRAFTGATQASVVAAILKDDPPPMTALRPVTPPALERLVRTCLAKDPERRWQSAGDLERELHWILEEGTSDSGTFTATPPAPTTRKRRTLLLAAVAGWSIAALALVAYFLGPMRPSDRPPPPLIRAEVPAPAHVTQWDFAFGGPMRISPDGRYLAFAVQEHARSGLWVHDLRKDERRRLEGTAGASYAFWSPDSRFIGFFAAHKLRKIPVEGGVIQPLCDAPDGRGAAWSRRGVILFAPNVWGPLYTVPAEGGTAEALTSTPDDHSHRFPEFLPDGRRFVFLQSRIVDLDCALMTASLDDPRATLLRSNLTAARFAAGRLLFEEEGTLFAQPLDSGRTALTGGPTPLVEGIMSYAGMGIANFAVSDNDILAYRTAYAREKTLEWFDAEGRHIGRLGSADTYTSVDLSPDGRRALAQVGSGPAEVSGLWILDAETGESARSVVRSGDEPVWSPDGERFAVVSETDIVIADVLRGTTRTVLTMETPTGIADWTADGRGLIVMQQHPETGTPNVMLLEIENGGEFRPIVETSDWDFPGRLSPDGRYLTFASDRRNPGSRSCELFVTELGGSGGVWQISTGGAPTGIGRRLCDWGRDGKRLYYLNRSGVLMRADIDTTNGFRAGTPVPVSPDLGKVTQVNVAPHGRLLVLRPSEDQPVPPVRLLTDWTALLDD